MNEIKVYAMLDKKLAMWTIEIDDYVEAARVVKEGEKIKTAVLALVK